MDSMDLCKKPCDMFLLVKIYFNQQTLMVSQLHRHQEQEMIQGERPNIMNLVHNISSSFYTQTLPRLLWLPISSYNYPTQF